jgi:hypothetical protein
MSTIVSAECAARFTFESECAASFTFEQTPKNKKD